MASVRLLPSELWAITEPVDGQGGFQEFLRELGSRLDGDCIELSPDELARVRQYADAYGPGGFQDRFKVIARAAERAAL